jgi:hypothetical protein
MSSTGRIAVPDVDHPTLCWKQEVRDGIVSTFLRCRYPKNHDGPHEWEKQKPKEFVE